MPSIIVLCNSSGCLYVCPIIIIFVHPLTVSINDIFDYFEYNLVTFSFRPVNISHASPKPHLQFLYSAILSVSLTSQVSRPYNLMLQIYYVLTSHFLMLMFNFIKVYRRLNFLSNADFVSPVRLLTYRVYFPSAITMLPRYEIH